MKTVDLRSDTVTLPTPEMREASYRAELGDDVYEEDPTVNRLQERAANMMGKEAALFVASGTMGNLISLLVHCGRGDQAIVGDLSHIALHEQSGASTLGGIGLRTVTNRPDGSIDLRDIEAAVNDDDIHCAKTRLVCLENTWHGHALGPEYIESVSAVARKHQLLLHIDGARLFNAAVALKVKPSDLVRHADSVQFCFSKGLAAPVGSMVCGDRKFVAEARRMRKLLGGGMRQVGVLAAACQVALDTMVGRLAEDHRHARLLADGLAHTPGLSVDPNGARTNMVFFNVAIPGVSNETLVEQLRQAGILVGADGALGIRAVTHYGLDVAEINEAVGRIGEVVASLGGRAPVTP